MDTGNPRTPGLDSGEANNQRHCYILNLKKLKAIEDLLESIQKMKLCLHSKH